MKSSLRPVRGSLLLLVAGGLLLSGISGCAKKSDSTAATSGSAGGAATSNAGADNPGAGNEEAKADNTSAPPSAAPPAAPAPPEMLAGAHILIPYKGAPNPPQGDAPERAEAEALAKKISEDLKKDPSNFAELATKYSKCPSAQKGGNLGTWHRGQMVKQFDEAAVALKVGEISGAVETPFGFHVIQRLALPVQLAGAHILLAYKGAMRANPSITRTKEEALKLAQKLATEVAADPEKLAALAGEHSSCPSGPRGGVLGKWFKGQMVPEFDVALEKLEVGGVTKEPVESPFGYHVIRRLDPATVGQ